MKNTKIMLAVVGTFIVTWLLLGLAFMLLSGNIGYRDALTDIFTVFIMIIFGWVPSVIVGSDLNAIHN